MSFAAFADTCAELGRLDNALNTLNQQQQAVYQQFQMVQEVLHSNASLLYGMPMRPQLTGQFPNYDEMVAGQKSVIQRGEHLYQPADQLLVKYNEIQEMKKPLQLEDLNWVALKRVSFGFL